MVYTLSRLEEKSRAGIAEEKKVRGTEEMFLLFSMGSQFDHLIKQALEKLGVFCMVADPASIVADDVREINPIGIILSGGPASVHTDPPPFDEKIFDLGIPVLGICLGFQMWAKHVGCQVAPAKKREFGVHQFRQYGVGNYDLFAGCPLEMPVLESHGDRIEKGPTIHSFGETDNAEVAAGSDNTATLWGVQFHPEVTETTCGEQIFKNFCFNICKAKDSFPAADKAKRKIDELRKQIGDKNVLLALSGGSDSSTCAYLLKNAMAGFKGKLFGVYIKGIDRADDESYVLQYFGHQDWITVTVVDATEDFLKILAGKITMKEKRVSMRDVYKPVLEREAARCKASFISQGTLYTDISETGGGYNTGADKAQIKLHHNVNLDFSLPEILPLSDCVKDGGRNIGRSIGVPEDLLLRHPFPGPGKVVRIEDEITSNNLDIEGQVDGIYIEELRRRNLYHTVWQAGAVLTKAVALPPYYYRSAKVATVPLTERFQIEGEEDEIRQKVAWRVANIYTAEVQRWQFEQSLFDYGAVVTRSVTTCTKGDGATNGMVIELWADRVSESLIVGAAELPWDFLKATAKRLTNEIREVGAVVYRIMPTAKNAKSGPMIALWSVWSVNGFTAQAAELPWGFLSLTAQRIRKEVLDGAGSVVYRISDKPPSTIEWG